MNKFKLYATCLLMMGTLPLASKVASSATPAGDDFFIHLHDPRAMANVTISAVHAGAVEISIQLETVEEVPLGNPDRGIAAVTAQARPTAEDQWSVRLPASSAGKWSLALGITLASETV